MAREILYCARCHRVILPREIDDGAYHFVDGDPVCSECFTRLSRRLRPVSGGRAESDTQPIPVNLTDLEKELSKGSQAAHASEGGRRERFSSGRLPLAAAPYRTGQILFMAFCFVLGTLLGGIAYSAYPVDRDKSAPPAPDKPPPNPAKVPAPETPKPVPGATVKLLPTADAYVRGGKHSAERFGRNPELKVKKGWPEFTREVFLRFDLSKVGSEVTGAHLLLHVVGSEKAEDIKHEARLVADHTWDEKTLNWDTKPSTGAPFASWSPLKETPVRIDVGKQVKATLRGNRQLSIGINAVTAAVGWVDYGSREAKDSRGPVLVLETSSRKLEPSAPVPKPEPKLPADGTWRLKPEADALVAGEKDADKKYGDRPMLTVASSDKGTTHKSYMRFKLGEVKGPITRATLHLAVSGRGGSRGLRQQIRLVNSNAWDEKTVAWKNAPKAEGKPLHSWMLALSAKSVKIDLTKAVQTALTGGGKLSVELSPGEGQKVAGWVNYHSKESDADKLPVLVISNKPEKAEPVEPEKPEPNPSAGEKSVRLPAEADAHVTGGKQSEVNKGKRAVLYIVNGISPDEEREAYIRFDLKTVKGEIAKAEIRLHPLSVKNSVGAANHVRLVTNNSWKESAVVWKGKPAAGKPFKTWVPKVGTPVVIDVTEHAGKAMKGDKKLSINLRITGAGKRGAWVTYGSRNGVKNRQPELIVVTGKHRPGLKAEFFKLPDTPAKLPELAGKTPAVTRIDAQINYPSTTEPWAGLPKKFANNFASRHTGYLKVEKAGTYTLYLESDDGSKLWLDDKLLIDNDGSHAMLEKTAKATLTAGYHRLRVQSFDGTAAAGLIVSCSGPGMEKKVIPADWLFHSASGGGK